MYKGLFRIGDKVTITISEETRGWSSEESYPFPDGIEGAICGFYNAITYEGRTWSLNRPGAYHFLGALSVWLLDGRIIDHLSETNLKLIDEDEYKKRLMERREDFKRDDYYKDKYTFLGDLPETPFWEQDKVRVTRKLFESDEDFGIMRITRIDYRQLHEKCNDNKTPMPIYTIELPTGGTTNVRAEDLELVERGNVWKYYHNEQLSFADVREEAEFFQMIGHVKEVRNPANGLYSWTKEEVMGALKDGTVHGLSVSGGLFGSGPRVSAMRFDNEELGKRVAKATLEGFEVAA